METTLKFKKRLKASTLVETLVALMLIVVSFSIGMMVFLNISRNTGTAKFAQSYWYTEEYFHQWQINNGEIPTEVVLPEGLILKAEDKLYQDQLHLVIVDIYNGEDKKIYSRRRIMGTD